jgi:hypothetical protein
MTTMTKSEFARHIERVPGYITQLDDAGRLVMDGDRVNVEASIKLIEETANPSYQAHSERHQLTRERKASGVIDEELNKVEFLSYQEARARRENFNNLLLEIAYLKEAGTLVIWKEEEFAIANAFAIFRNKFDSLAEKLAPQLAIEKDDHKIKMMLIEEIEDIFNDLHKAMKEMAERAKANE